jgi:hypothetical protein
MCKCFGEGDGRDGSWRPCPPDLCEADVLVEAAAAREERLAELEAERDRLREALRQCRELFVDLRSDWSDNRGPCPGGLRHYRRCPGRREAVTWREKVVVSILLLVARMLCDDAGFADEIKTLATHVSVNAPKPAAALGETT